MCVKTAEIKVGSKYKSPVGFIVKVLDVELRYNSVMKEYRTVVTFGYVDIDNIEPSWEDLEYFVSGYRKL